MTLVYPQESMSCALTKKEILLLNSRKQMSKIDFYIIPQEPDSTLLEVADTVVTTTPKDDISDSIADSTNVEVAQETEADSVEVSLQSDSLTAEVDTATNSQEADVVEVVERTEERVERREEIVEEEQEVEVDSVALLEANYHPELYGKNFFYCFNGVNEEQELSLDTIRLDTTQKETQAAEKILLEPKLRKQPTKIDTSFSTDWLIAVFILELIVLSWIRLFYKKYLRMVLRAAVNGTMLNTLHRDNNSNYQRFSLVGTGLFVLNISVLSYLLLKYNSVSLFTDGIPLFLIINGIFMLIYLSKYVINKILGIIFMADQEISEYLNCVFVYNKTFGFLLFPMIVAIPFVFDDLKIVLINASLILALIIYVLRILRGWQIAFRQNLSISYRILYLCTLELLPLLVLFKLVKELI